MTAAEAKHAGVSPWAIAALSFAAFAASASMRVTDALLPTLDAEFGTGLGAAAQVVTAFAIAYGILQAPYGLIGDRLGKYRLVAWTCIAAAFAAALCALAGSFGMLVEYLLYAPLDETCAETVYKHSLVFFISQQFLASELQVSGQCTGGG